MGKYVGKNALTAFWNGIKAMFSDVAFSGDYDDLDSKPSVETAASGGTTKSLVTTGEKYDWNGKASVQELTKAQYEALSEAQKNNGTIYMITDDDGGWEAERSIYDNSDSGLSATNVQDAIDELSDEFSSTFKIKYKNTNWSTIHSFPVETVNRIGLILTHDGTLYSFVQYASTGNFSITKLAGTHTITASVQDGYNRLSIDASVGLIVVTI